MTIGKIKFSQLPAQVETDLDANTIFAVVNLGISKKATIGNIKNYLVYDGMATKDYVDTAVNNLVAGAPGILDTLNELADALNNDANFYATITGMIADSATNLFPSKTTDDLAEGATNLYFTTQRSRTSISISDPTNSLTYDPATGVITFNAGSGGFVTSVNGAIGDVTLDSDRINEGYENLYFTDARARDSLSGGTGVTYDNTTGVISIGQAVGPTDTVTFLDVGVTDDLNVGDAANIGGNLQVGGNFNLTGNVTSDIHIVDTTASTSPSTGALVVEGGVGILGDLNVENGLNVGGDLNVDGTFNAGTIAVDDIEISGTITHQGLVPSDGTNIDQIMTYTRSLRLLTDWQDVGINAGNLVTGTYIVQLYAHDTGAGGTNNNEYYSGIMSWYQGDTNSSEQMPTDEIPLHRAGGSSDGNLYLRTFRTASADPNNLKLQIYSNIEAASAANYVFKFRRVI